MKKQRVDLDDIELKLRRAAAEGTSPALVDVVRSLAQAVASGPGAGAFASAAASSVGPTPAAPVLFDFVFAPGHPGPLPSNVFTAWGDLVAAANQVGGIPYVTFDDTHAPVEIPAGNWAFTTCRPVFRGDLVNERLLGAVQVTMADGAKLSGVHTFRDLFVISVSSSPVISSPPGPIPVYVLEGNANLRADGSAPLIEHNVPQICMVYVLDNAQLLKGASPVFRLGTPGEPFQLFTWGSGYVESNTISGVPGRHYGGRISQSDGFIEPTQDTPGFAIALGALDAGIQHFRVDAVASETSWGQGAAPFDTYGAIERIAAALVARTGGTPIP